MNDKTHFQGVFVHRLEYGEVVEIFKDYLLGNWKRSVGFINAHDVNVARKDDEYKEIINNFDLVLADGIGITIARVAHNDALLENLNGTDLLPRLLSELVPTGAKIFLVGGKPGISCMAKKSLEKKIPGIKIVGCEHGYFNEREQNVLDAINNVCPDIVMVGMGVPIQEKWIARNKDKINAKIFIGVGGFFDFEAGVVKRAPLWMRKIGLEWLFRIYQEPGRLWKRYFLVIPSFYIMC